MSLTDMKGKIWMDGTFVDWRDAKVHVLTHALHYGTGVFEGVRCYATDRGPAIFRLKDHTERLFQSAKIIGLDIPFSVAELNEVQQELIRINALDSAYIRPLAYLGAEGLGLTTKNLQTHVMIAAWSWGAYLGADALQQGVRVMVSSFTRHHINSMMCKAKVGGNYVNSVLARGEAERLGMDEAILLDTNGFVAEGSGENIFIVRDGQLYTPTAASVLEGLTKAAVIQLAEEELGLTVLAKPITRDELYIADEVFFTGTAVELTSVREIDGRPIADGQPGAITKALQQVYFDQVMGRRSEHPEWLTFV